MAGRSILHNVMIFQDLVEGDKIKTTIASCMIRLKKSICYGNWRLRQMLVGVGFPHKFTELIITCFQSC